MTVYAKYIGTSDVRVIRKGDWEAADIPDMPAVRWDAKNGWCVSRETFTDEAWNTVILPDTGFVMVGDEDEVAAERIKARDYEPQYNQRAAGNRAGREHSASITKADAEGPGITVKTEG